MTAFKRHKDADERIADGHELIRLLLAASGLRAPIRRKYLSLAIWEVTVAEGGKYGTRFRSTDSLRPGAKLRHDHVTERRKIVDELLVHPERLEEILGKAVGCVVTKDEHDRLTRISREQPDLGGWDRYQAAGVTVVDLTAQADLLGGTDVLPDAPIVDAVPVHDGAAA